MALPTDAPVPTVLAAALATAPTGMGAARFEPVAVAHSACAVYRDRMRLGRAMGTTAAVLLWALPVQASAQELAASCPGPRESAVLSGTGGSARFAQTFSTPITGGVTIAQVDVTKLGSAGDYRLDINEVDGAGVPTNTVLSSTMIPDAAVLAGDSIITGTFADPAPVSAGQQYALIVTRPASTGLQVGVRTGDDCPGMLLFSGNQVDAFSPAGGTDAVFNVFVTPSPPAAGPDQTPPETQITNGPKDKTKKKQATFEFTSSEPGSTFQCTLDGQQQFKPCASPLTIRVKKGKHTFSVQATDQAGNTDATLASDDWKVKKKKRK